MFSAEGRAHACELRSFDCDEVLTCSKALESIMTGRRCFLCGVAWSEMAWSISLRLRSKDERAHQIVCRWGRIFFRGSTWSTAEYGLGKT